jgi:hypothetical protein
MKTTRFNNHYFLYVLCLLVSLVSLRSMAGTSSSNVVLSGNVISSCTLLGSTVNLGDVRAGTVATTSISVSIACDSALPWTLKGPSSYTAFSIGGGASYYSVIYKDAARTQPLTTTTTATGTDTATVSLTAAIGRSVAGTPLTALTNLAHTGTFSSTVPLTLDF